MNTHPSSSPLNQNRAPIHEALEQFRQKRVVPFDVPGHKRGRGNPELTDFLGEQCVSVDVNSMKPLDNLCHPISVIREAEELAADAFGAAHAFLMVGGTTSAVQSMVLTVCKRGDEIILPRNVHRSVINALVLCGAIPVYVNPEVDHRLGISLGMKREQVARAIKEHPKAVAVLVNNPTYYGICSDLKEIVKLAHDHNMLCLADEAHGTHFYFGKDLPISAMAAGADLASVSMHKSGGSLTQSSFLLAGPNMNEGYIRQIINLTQTTSGSYLLMSSLDISRRNLALRGEKIFEQVRRIAEYARNEINSIGGYYAFGPELINGDSIFDFDPIKLSIHTLDIGLAGIEVYDLLRDDYDIQIEFGDIGNILAYLSIGDRIQEVERLVSALSEIRRRFQHDSTGMLSQEYIPPKVIVSPQDAFYADKISLPIMETEGMICSEFVMCYPPGIPILAPGEKITADILNYIKYAKEKGCNMTGPEDPAIERLNVLKNYHLY
ncbi:MAG: aminotransferase class I/II-fold pyridoxal phosphate-dependent enzyme [Lachnospiraceae bacterium]|nr:aminotransferase class I/II-fold pyridoxal phosphate-dependent enzyme [Lachnospiraceae bacterium]